MFIGVAFIWASAWFMSLVAEDLWAYILTRQVFFRGRGHDSVHGVGFNWNDQIL